MKEVLKVLIHQCKNSTSPNPSLLKILYLAEDNISCLLKSCFIAVCYDKTCQHELIIKLSPCWLRSADSYELTMGIKSFAPAKKLDQTQEAPSKLTIYQSTRFDPLCIKNWLSCHGDSNNDISSRYSLFHCSENFCSNLICKLLCIGKGSTPHSDLK